MAGTVTIKILGDASNFSRTLGETESGLAGFSQKMQRVGSNLMGIGAKMTVGITAPLVLMGKQAVDAASNLEQSIGAVESVFGSAGAKIQKFGETAAQSFGLSRREVNETAAVLGAQLQSMGRSADEAAGEVITLQQRAADMAATFGGTTTEALESISALMRGERDPIEKYGVSLKQVDINARIAADGLDTSTVAAQKQSEATAAMSILLEQTANVQGQFARESDTAAGAQARAAAQYENARAALGEGLLPIMTKVMTVVSEVATAFTNLSPTMQNTVLVVAGLAAAVGPLVTVIGALVTGIGLLLTPVGLVIGALALLAAGAVYAYTEFEGFRNVVDGVVSWLRNTAFPIVVTVASGIGAAFGAMASSVSYWMGMVRSVVSSVIGAIRGVINVGLAAIQGDWSGVWNGLAGIVNKAITGVLVLASNLPGQILGALGDLGSLLYNSGRALMRGFANGIKSMVGAVTGAMGDVLEAGREWFPFSPAKKGPFSGRGWTAYSGQALAEGLAQGMRSRTGMVSSAAGLLADAAYPSLGMGGMGGAMAAGRAASPIHIENLYAAPGRSLHEELALTEALYRPRVL